MIIFLIIWFNYYVYGDNDILKCKFQIERKFRIVLGNCFYYVLVVQISFYSYSFFFEGIIVFLQILVVQGGICWKIKSLQNVVKKNF